MEIRIFGIEGLPEVKPGMDLTRLIVEAAQAQGTPLLERDILVVTQKVVSKAEGQLVDLSAVTPSALALGWAKQYGRDPRLVEVALREARRISRMDYGVMLVETHHGFYCINAGVDASNIPGSGMVALLPKDADASAARIREEVRRVTGLGVAVVITDSWGRPWREGITNVAIGAAGIAVLKDYRGTTDTYGHELRASAIAVVDEIASAAELVMGKVDMVPVALVRGYGYTPSEGKVRDLLRDPERDMFR
ncbi:MAG: coenzyme F420-0:L-glutamate ligase [Chloroflexi bacterium]|nr:coenzyme F420-0:L-glutamate ligase [Chloroflexota bacterium]